MVGGGINSHHRAKIEGIDFCGELHYRGERLCLRPRRLGLLYPQGRVRAVPVSGERILCLHRRQRHLRVLGIGHRAGHLCLCAGDEQRHFV
jgi:hypothetical protein